MQKTGVLDPWIYNCTRGPQHRSRRVVIFTFRAPCRCQVMRAPWSVHIALLAGISVLLPGIDLMSSVTYLADLSKSMEEIMKKRRQMRLNIICHCNYTWRHRAEKWKSTFILLWTPYIAGSECLNQRLGWMVGNKKYIQNFWSFPYACYEGTWQRGGQLHSFLTLTLDGSCQLHGPATLPPGKGHYFCLIMPPLYRTIYNNHFNIWKIYLQTFMHWYDSMPLYCIRSEVLNFQHSGAASEMYDCICLYIIPAIYVARHIVIHGCLR